MKIWGTAALNLVALAFAAGSAAAQSTAPNPDTQPGVAPAATTRPAAVPGTAPANAPKPRVDDLLPKDAVQLDFDDVPMKDVLAAMGDKYGIDIHNAFDIVGRTTENDQDVDAPMRTTLHRKLTAREALNLMNASLLVVGYRLAENVAGDPPHVIITVYQSGTDTTQIKVAYGSDPDKIPEGSEMRTQVMTLARVKPSDARSDIEAILGKTTITVDDQVMQLTITDTASHVHTAARMIQLMEKKAATTAPEGNK